MDSRRWKRIACITGICVLIGIVSFLAYRNYRQRLAQEQAEAAWETRYAQDVADMEARYAENREDLFLVFEAFQKDETLKTVHRLDPDEYHLLPGYRYWRDFQNEDPELYQAIAALDQRGFGWEVFGRGCSCLREDDEIINCRFSERQYRRRYTVEIYLLFCGSEPKWPEDIDYCIQLDENCWLLANEYPLPD